MSTSTSMVTAAERSNFLARWYDREPLLARFTLAVLMSSPLLFLAAQIDERTLDGVNIWTKSIKFHVAIDLYFGTLVCSTTLSIDRDKYYEQANYCVRAVYLCRCRKYRWHTSSVIGQQSAGYIADPAISLELWQAL